MCDYSLHSVACRPAKPGDELVTTRSAGSQTRGFHAVGEPGVAVCLRPGTELAFKDEAEIDYPLHWLTSKLSIGKLGQKVARFRQISLAAPHRHHDALEFGNGKIVLLRRLRPGLHVTVLQLPVTTASMPGPCVDGQEPRMRAR